MGCTEIGRAISRVLRALGILICISILTLGIVLFLHLKTQVDSSIGADFYAVNHCLAVALLLVAFAVGTSWTELRGLFKMPTSKFGFFRSRFSLAIAYGWIGTYCLGGVVTGDQGWITLARVTGFAGWTIAAGNLLYAFCFKGKNWFAEDDDLKQSASQKNSSNSESEEAKPRRSASKYEATNKSPSISKSDAEFIRENFIGARSQTAPVRTSNATVESQV